MKLSYEDHQHITVITVSGELTVDQADAFRRACQDRMANGIRHVVLDIQHLSSVDSAGLELMLWLVDELGKQQGHLRLVNPDETVAMVLRLTRLDRRFDIHQSIESAAKSLRN
jgi:anti-sigma B factor antagonist